MTQKKDNTQKELDWREIFGSGPDGLRELRVQQIVQEVLEADMDGAVGAQKSERTAERVGYRSRYYTADVGDAGGGNWCCGYRRINKGDFGRKCLSGINGVRKRWCRRWPRCVHPGGVDAQGEKEITEQLCGHEFFGGRPSAEVTEKLDGELQKFARRGLEEEYPILGGGCALRKGAGRWRD